MPLKFRKVMIADTRFESCGVFDVNNDGVLDIVCGEFWYEGPNWTDPKSIHFIGPVQPIGEYYDDFSTIALDITGNGYLDFVDASWFVDTLRWKENPNNPNEQWKEHVIDTIGNIETTRGVDIDGDGIIEIIPNAPAKPVVIYKLITDENGKGTGQFESHEIYSKPQGHGIGFGDIAGNGRVDIVITDGWLEAPEKPYEEEWIFHPDFNLGSASVPVLVCDVNRDGVNDLIVGQAHAYGLDWWEQVISADGSRSWKKHPIDPYNSQYHDMIWADIDNDGECELITGKRYRAHCGNDPGDYDDYGLYYFKWNGESFSKQVISYGGPREGKGTGIFFQVADLRGTGRLDVIVAGKDGLYVFFNEGL